MPDKKISALDAIVTIATDDVLPIVDTSASTTKKISIAQIKSEAPVQSVASKTGKLLVDKDHGEKYETIGTRYIDVESLFNDNEVVTLSNVDIYNNKAVKDKDLSQGVKVEDLNK